MKGAEMITDERRRQIVVEGWTSEHDDGHKDDLTAAAACYLEAATVGPPPLSYDDVDHVWPWDEDSWKPSDDPIRNLVKAGALIAAEIDRLLREKS